MQLNIQIRNTGNVELVSATATDVHWFREQTVSNTAIENLMLGMEVDGVAVPGMVVTETPVPGQPLKGTLNVTEAQFDAMVGA